MELFNQLGFSEYEAKTYQTLMKVNPQTAYETAKSSGIPSSKIYAVLDRMEEKGLVQAITEGGKKLYIPLELEDFIEGQRSRMNRNLDSLSESLKEDMQDKASSYVWNLKNRDDLIEKAIELVSFSDTAILLSLWKEEYLELEPFLKEKEKEGVKIALVHFGEKPGHIGIMYRHPIEDTLFQEKGGRSFSLVSDSRAALMGTIDPKGNTEASWSRSYGFTSLAEDYIRHDIYIMKIVQRFDTQLVENFGEKYQLLRDIFNDRSL